LDPARSQVTRQRARECVPPNEPRPKEAVIRRAARECVPLDDTRPYGSAQEPTNSTTGKGAVKERDRRRTHSVHEPRSSGPVFPSAATMSRHPERSEGSAFLAIPPGSRHVVASKTPAAFQSPRNLRLYSSPFHRHPISLAPHPHHSHVICRRGVHVLCQRRTEPASRRFLDNL